MVEHVLSMRKDLVSYCKEYISQALFTHGWGHLSSGQCEARFHSLQFVTGH